MKPWVGLGYALLHVALTGCGAARYHAAPLTPEQVATRLDRRMAARGFERVGAMAHVPALGTGRSVAHALQVAGPACYEGGAIPVGDDRVEVSVQDSGGAPLATVAGEAHESAYFCVAGAASYRFVVTSLDGAAEYYFVVYRGASGVEPALDEVLAGIGEQVPENELRGDASRTATSEDDAAAPETTPAPRPEPVAERGAGPGDAARSSEAPTGSGDGDGTMDADTRRLAERCRDADPTILDPFCVEGSAGAAALARLQAQEERARELFEQGMERLRADDAMTAAAHLMASYRLNPRASVLINLAAAQGRIGQTVQSARDYTLFLTLEDEGITPRQRRAARRALRTLRREVATLRLEAPSDGTGYVELDEQPVKPWAFEVDYPVEPGRHELTYSVDGEVVSSDAATIARGEGATLRVEAP